MVNYKAEMIQSYFGSGSSFGIELEYFNEEYPRGTAGPLSVLKGRVNSPLVVMNSDVLTNLRFSGLVQFHQQQNADLTVALKELNRRLAYGIVDVGDDMVISGFREKPHLTFLINSGIYVLSPDAISLVPDSGRLLMTELIERAVEVGMKVTGYKFTEEWVDIGRLDNYMRTLGNLEDGIESDTEMVFMREDNEDGQSPVSDKG
jgi:NDP-sugar pyrophosphorylase family protein